MLSKLEGCKPRTYNTPVRHKQDTHLIMHLRYWSCNKNIAVLKRWVKSETERWRNPSWTVGPCCQLVRWCNSTMRPHFASMRVSYNGKYIGFPSREHGFDSRYSLQRVFYLCFHFLAPKKSKSIRMTYVRKTVMSENYKAGIHAVYSNGHISVDNGTKSITHLKPWDMQPDKGAAAKLYRRVQYCSFNWQLWCCWPYTDIPMRSRLYVNSLWKQIP